MNQVDVFIELFGSASNMARALGHNFPSTVSSWKRQGYVPTKDHQAVYDALVANDLPVRVSDFIAVKELREQVAA